MKQPLLFECKKIIKKKVTWVAFFLAVAASIALYFFNYSVAEKIHQGNINRFQTLSVMFKSAAEDAKIEKKAAEKRKDLEEVKLQSSLVKNYQASMKNSLRNKNLYINEDWKKIFKSNVKQLEYPIKQNKDSTNPSVFIENQQISWFTTRATLEENKLKEKNNLVPFIQNTVYTSYLPTIYDNFTGSSLTAWQKETKRYGTTGISFLYQLIQNLYLPVITLIGCFIFGNNLTSEMNSKKKGLHYYFVQPIRRRALFLAKYFSGLIYTLGFVLFMMLVPLVCSLFTKGIGSLKYPVLVYEGAKPNPFGSEYNSLNPSEDQFHFINISEYLWKTLLLTIFLVLFLYSIYYILSLYIKSPVLTIILIGLLTYVGMKEFISRYNPFTFVDIHKLLNGEAATLAFNPGINFQHGVQLFIIVSLILVCLLFFLGFKRFNKGIN